LWIELTEIEPEHDKVYDLSQKIEGMFQISEFRGQSRRPNPISGHGVSYLAAKLHEANALYHDVPFGQPPRRAVRPRSDDRRSSRLIVVVSIIVDELFGFRGNVQIVGKVAWRS
jgi:hypothetical protein